MAVEAANSVFACQLDCPFGRRSSTLVAEPPLVAGDGSPFSGNRRSYDIQAIPSGFGPSDRKALPFKPMQCFKNSLRDHTGNCTHNLAEFELDWPTE